MAKIGRNEPCPCGSGRKYKRCCLEQDEARAARGRATREALVGTSSPDVRPPRDGAIDLVIDTPAGPMIRHIPTAMPPRLAGPHGKAVEAATHDAATVWGLPDLVLRPTLVQAGHGSRELGDGIMLAGAIGLVVQVKARSTPSEEQSRETRWLTKNVAKALRQARGTVRRFARGPVEMRNQRGRPVIVEVGTRRWLGVVIIDHPAIPPSFVPAAEDELGQAVVLARRDWDFLFDQLKCINAVATYLARVAGEPLPLGEEPMRYYRLAQLDADAKPAPLDERYRLGDKGTHFVEPLLPLAPAATHDRDAHAMFRTLLEDVATTRLTSASEERRIQILEELDGLAVGQRALIGRYVLDAFAELEQLRDPIGVTWRLRRVSGGGLTQLGFGACSRLNDEIQIGFQGWTMLRHHEFTARLQAKDSQTTTVAVVVSPRRDDQRVWDTTVCAIGGPLDLGREELASLREVWGDERDAVLEA
jgi:hypothetical protein